MSTIVPSIGVGASTVPFPAWTVDPDEATRRFRDAGVAVSSVRPVYLRDKPGESLIVGYELRADDRVERGYVRWCADPARAAVERSKAFALSPVDGPLGAGVTPVGDHATLRLLPNDAELRRARWYLTPRKLKRSLADMDHGGRRLSGSATSVTVLTYKPERRIVARLDLGHRDGHRRQVLLRHTSTPSAEHLATVAHHVGRHGVATARPLARLEGGSVGVDEFLPGVDLVAAVTSDRVRPHVVDAVADQIATLHRVPPAAGIGRRTRTGEVAAAFDALDWLCARDLADRFVADTLRATIVEAARVVPETAPVVIHGDLHDRNVLVDTDASVGGATVAQAYLIDLERVAVGEAAIDLGYLLAHGLALDVAHGGGTAGCLAAAVVTDVIDRSGPRGPGNDALALHGAIGLVDAALTSARRLDTQTDPTLVDRLLATAHTVLADPDTIVATG